MEEKVFEKLVLDGRKLGREKNFRKFILKYNTWSVVNFKGKN